MRNAVRNPKGLTMSLRLQRPLCSGYCQRQGFLMVPARVVQAAAPFLFGLTVERWGVGSLWCSAVLGLAACFALVVMTQDMKGSGSRNGSGMRSS